MNYEDYLKLDIPEKFGTDDADDEVPEKIFDQLDSSVVTKWGVTQFVIIDNRLDEVIKIPFNGEFIRSFDYEKQEWNEGIFEPYINDYMEIAEDIYNRAKNEGFEEFFAKMTLIGKTENGTSVFRQEYVTPYDDYDSESAPSTDSIAIVKDSKNKDHREWRKWSIFEEDWIAYAVDVYGFDYVTKFLDFVIKEQSRGKLLDLHLGNYGWRKDGTPAILDWAGYEE